MFSAFFITRPKFAFVISIVLTLAGLIALNALPVALYPELTPPQVKVSTFYPGADAETISETVAGPLESRINGVEDMLYMSSNSANDGSYSLTVSFAVGSDPDLNTVNVQNRVSQAMAELPEEVTRQGVTTTKQSSNMLLIVNLFSPQESYDSVFLSNYASINLLDVLKRVPGVGNAEILGGQDYAMRIWLDPERMTGLGLSVEDIVAALREQNVQVAAGQIGAPPAVEATAFQLNLRTQGRLDTAQAFEQVVLRIDDLGAQVRLRDVARVELGASAYSSYGLFNGRPSTVMAIYQLPGANALAVADGVRARMRELAERFPDDIAYDIAYDTTDFVRASIDEVVVTLFVALLLVVLVVYLFIQDVRSTLVPTIAIPVSLIGTFAGMLLLGYSINLITLFGLILAIGIVVDDAIIVVENTQRHMREGMTPAEATRKAMSEISGAIIATTLVLLAVFVPMAFMPGLTGELFRQFAVTISLAVAISSVNALTLSPALCATLLRAEGSELTTRGPFGLFNRGFDLMTRIYGSIVGGTVRFSVLVLALFAGSVALAVVLYGQMPTGFVPEEDQKVIMVDVQLPEGASLQRTGAVMDRVNQLLAETPGVADVISVPGYSMIRQGVTSSGGLSIAVLDSWEERASPDMHEAAVLARLRPQLASIAEATVFAFRTPPIPGLGNTGGFEFILQSIAGDSAAAMAGVYGGLAIAANQRPELAAVFSTFKAAVPQVFLDIDRDKAKLLGVDLDRIFTALSGMTGQVYANDFNRFGKTYQVLLQADAPYRMQREDIERLHVRNRDGEMVPLRTLLRTAPVFGPDQVSRYNILRSIRVNGSAAVGHSSGEAIVAMEQVAQATLPAGYSYEWTGQAFQEIQAAGQAGFLFALALVFVYLFLVAQYESWSIPLAVLLAVPPAILGAVVAQTLAGQANDIYMQVGVVLLMGLATKNAILIVEFARELREREGLPIVEAAVSAARLRLRAVVMTALSFVLGVIPLVVASGAGAASRNSLGMVVFGGMLAATLMIPLLVPLFFVLIQRMREWAKGRAAPAVEGADAAR